MMGIGAPVVRSRYRVVVHADNAAHDRLAALSTGEPIEFRPGLWVGSYYAPDPTPPEGWYHWWVYDGPTLLATNDKLTRHMIGRVCDEHELPGLSTNR